MCYRQLKTHKTYKIKSQPRHDVTWFTLRSSTTSRDSYMYESSTESVEVIQKPLDINIPAQVTF